MWSGVRRSPPRAAGQWYGLVGLACANRGRGPTLPINVVVVLGRPGSHASHKPHNVARAPVFLNFNLYAKPDTQPETLPKCRL